MPSVSLRQSERHGRGPGRVCGVHFFIPPPIQFKCTIDHLSPEFLWRVTLRPRYQFNSFSGLSPTSDWLRCARLLQQVCARSPTLCARGYVLLIFSGWVCGRDCPARCACLYNAHKGWQPQEQAKEGLVSKKSWNKRLNQCVTCFRCCYVEYTS